MNPAGFPPILHVDSGKERRGGQAQVLLLLKGLRDMGAAQRLVCPPGAPLEQRAREEGIEVRTVPMRSEWSPLAPRRLVRAARDLGAGIVHAHASLAHGLCWRALRGLPDVPLLVTRRVDFPVGGNWFSAAKHRNARTRYLAISRGVRDVLIEGGVAPERVEIVHSGIDPARFEGKGGREDLVAEFALPPEAFIVCNIAALSGRGGATCAGLLPRNALPYSGRGRVALGLGVANRPSGPRGKGSPDRPSRGCGEIPRRHGLVCPPLAPRGALHFASRRALLREAGRGRPHGGRAGRCRRRTQRPAGRAARSPGIGRGDCPVDPRPGSPRAFRPGRPSDGRGGVYGPADGGRNGWGIPATGGEMLNIEYRILNVEC
jgi:hypothetical protein